MILIESNDISEIRSKVAKELAGRKVTRFEFHSHGEPGRVLVGREVLDMDRLFNPAIFARDAKVRFHGCSVADGEKGNRHLNELVRQIPGKGVAFGSELVTMPGYPRLDPAIRVFPVLGIPFGAMVGTLPKVPLYYVDPKTKVVRIGEP